LVLIGFGVLLTGKGDHPHLSSASSSIGTYRLWGKRRATLKPSLNRIIAALLEKEGKKKTCNFICFLKSKEKKSCSGR